MIEIRVGDIVQFIGWKPLGEEADADFATIKSPVIDERGIVSQVREPRLRSKYPYLVHFNRGKDEWMSSGEIELVELGE